MLTKRIIPCLDVKNGRTVKGTNFLNLRDAGDPVELGARYSDEGADELVFLDISATLEGRSTFLSMVERVAEAIHIPFTVGGGIRTIDDIVKALDAGADKVSLNSAALANPDLINQASKRVGTQSVVVAIDVKRSGTTWTVWTKAGTEPTGRDALVWSREVVERGAGELLVTSMDRDGTTSGYDIELLQVLSECVSVPIIASGGAGTMYHALEAIVHGKADAVLAASIFHYQKIKIKELKQFLHSHGIPVRV
ncbi:MAG: imidazole glycerol phosphate synthase subunit HisF [Bacteroidetes bacterium]|nr:imidazole glycerol phosphate synthase subunit HisF [Bacteroidota bacterium]